MVVTMLYVSMDSEHHVHSLLLWLVNYSSLIQVTEEDYAMGLAFSRRFRIGESMMSFISVVVGVVIAMLC